jgi:cobalt-zinc-cadmium efflux system outer membrane protein
MWKWIVVISTLLTFSVFLFFSSQAFAEAPTASAKSLLAQRQALVAWLDAHQPALATLSSRRREATASTRDAALLPNPVVTLGTAGVTFWNRNPSSLSFSDTLNLQVTVAETVELGKRSHRVKAAELHADAIDNNTAYAKALLVADARESLGKLVYVSAARRALETRLKSAQGVLELDQVRLEHGDVSAIDHSRLELEIINVQRELADNAADLADAQAQCAASLGAPCSSDAEVDVLESSLARPPTRQLAGFAPSRRADVKALRFEAQSSLELARLYDNRKLPDPQIGVSYLYDRLTAAGNQPHTFGVFVSLPLPISDHGQHQSAQAQERAKQSESEAARLEILAKSESQNLLTSEELTRKKLELLRSQAIPKGLKVLEATESAYRIGQVSLTDLLLARRQQADLMSDLVETYYALFQLRSQIYRVFGLDTLGRDTP